MKTFVKTLKAKRYTNTFYFIVYDLLSLSNKTARKTVVKYALYAVLASLIVSIISLKWLTIFGSGIMFVLLCLVIFGIIESQRLLYVERVENYDHYHKVYRKPGSGGHWMTEEEKEAAVDRFSSIYDTDGFILGKDDDNKLYVAKKHGADYTAIFAPTGGSKGTGQIINRHLQAMAAGRSIYSSSTKDDNFKETCAIAKYLGYIIKLVICDPHYIKNSDSVNYLDLIKGSDSEKVTIAHTLAKAMLDNTPNPEYDFWYEGAENLFASMMLVVKEAPRSFEKYNSFGGIYRFLTEHADVDEFCEILDVIVTEDSLAYEGYSVFKTKKGSSEVVKLQTIQGLAYKLNALQSDDAKAVVSYKDIDLSLPGKQKCIYYVISSANINPYTFIASMFFTMSFMELEVAAKENGGKLKVPVDFIFDELKAVGTIPKFEETIDTIRAIGVRMTLCTQSITQLDQMYGEQARISILNNCATQILIETSDEDVTAKHFSTLAGKFTGLIENKDSNGRKTVSERSMDLFPIEWATHLTNEVFIYLQGRKGVLMLKPQYYYADFPGSKVNIYNDFDGKVYHAHPLLEHRKPVNMSKHTPKWQKAKKVKQKEKKEIKNTKISDTQYEYEEE